jgi:hypothetical protein
MLRLSVGGERNGNFESRSLPCLWRGAPRAGPLLFAHLRKGAVKRTDPVGKRQYRGFVLTPTLPQSPSFQFIRASRAKWFLPSAIKDISISLEDWREPRLHIRFSKITLFPG